MFDRIRDLLQLDQTLYFALATRLWQAFSGPVTIVLLIRYLSVPQQGIYYGLASVVGIQAYFELGLLNVLVSQAGHESAAIRRHSGVPHPKSDSAENAGSAENDSGAVGRNFSEPSSSDVAQIRMGDLIRQSRHWFFWGSILFTVGAYGLGWASMAGSDVAWQYPLMFLVPLAAVSVAFAPSISILEGAGDRDLVYRFRMIQMVIGSLGVWSALALGLGIWSLVISFGIQAALSFQLVYITRRSYFRQFEFTEVGNVAERLDWWRDIMPIQWRVALVSAAYHFATQFFTIIVLWFHGDVAVAPLGMTLSATTAIQMLALAWVQTKYPVVAELHGSGDREAAGTMWRQTAIVSVGLLLLAIATLIAIVWALPYLGLGIEERFLAPWQIVVLGIGCVANHLTATQAFYVLSRKAKPLLVPQLVGLLSVAGLVWMGGYQFSSSGIVVGYAIGMTCLFLPLHTIGYIKFRSQLELA